MGCCRLWRQRQRRSAARALPGSAEPLGLALSVAHLDHGVRGEAARADAAFVAELAESLGLPVDLGRWQPVRSPLRSRRARRARYDWLTQVARARGAGAVAVGHTRDDQAETILHRILRGTGPRGLARHSRRGERWRRTRGSTLVRPLLRRLAARIREFLSAIDQPFREDETNAVLSRTRSRIRHDLLPKLAAEYNPAVSRALVRLGALSAALERAIDRDARSRAAQRDGHGERGAVVLKHGVLRSTPAILADGDSAAGCGGVRAGPRRACRHVAGGGWRALIRKERDRTCRDRCPS